MMKVKVFKIRLPEEFLYKDQKMLDDFLEVNEIMKVETAFVSEERYWSVILYFEDAKPAKNTVKEPKTVKYSAENDFLNTDEEKILDALKLWRSEKAREQNLPTYFIASNKELLSVAKYKLPEKKNYWRSKDLESIRLKTMVKRFLKSLKVYDFSE